MPPDTLDTLMGIMSEIADPMSVSENFVRPDRLPPRKRRSSGSSARTFTAHGQGHGP